MDFSWVKEAHERFKRYSTLCTKEGQRLFDFVRRANGSMNITKEEYLETWRDIQIFLADPENPEEDKDKIGDEMSDIFGWSYRFGTNRNLEDDLLYEEELKEAIIAKRKELKANK